LYTTLSGDTLGESLDYAGGPDTAGGAQILLRAAVPALLNANHPGVNYLLTPIQVANQVNATLGTQDRDTMLNLAMQLDTYNLTCPLP
jgi:hypothetical protein